MYSKSTEFLDSFVCGGVSVFVPVLPDCINTAAESQPLQGSCRGFIEPRGVYDKGSWLFKTGRFGFLRHCRQQGFFLILSFKVSALFNQDSVLSEVEHRIHLKMGQGF